MSSHEQLEALYQQGLIVFPKKTGGQPMYKQYVGPGVTYQDLWAYQRNTKGVLFDSDEHIDEDVKWLEDEDERIGWETQKPVGLLRRILTTYCDPNAVVLDPFCGCGTALVAAQEMGMRWIGIDVTYLSIAVMQDRLKRMFPKLDIVAGSIPTEVEGARLWVKADPDNRFEFQYLCIALIEAVPVGGKNKKGADKGMDGVITFTDENGKVRKVIVSVKSGGVQVKDIRDLVGAMSRESAPLGVFVTLEEPTGPMKTEAASAGSYHVAWWGQHRPVRPVADIPGPSRWQASRPAAVAPSGLHEGGN